ncbi:MAG: cation:proton antiporter [Alphaproteobacteria bacterium]|nr:MAG: cation:proton antiporter [Alphaproteobacteria bacterium]
MIALGIGALLAVAIALTSLRLFASATLYDRALAVNTIVLQAALVCAAGAAALGSVEGADAALVMVLGLFVLNAAALKFFRARTFQAPLARPEERL